MGKKQDTKELVERLRGVPRLSGLDDDGLRAVAEAGTRVHLPAEWTLISESTPADKAYVILSGDVEVRRGGQTVASVGSGDVIGETGIMEHRLRTASVVSRTELDVVHFTQDDFAALARDLPAFAAAMQATADDRLGTDEDGRDG